MKLTPKKYKLIEKKWRKRLSLNNKKPLHSASKKQKHTARKFDPQFFKYVPCPICNEEHYTILHKRTLYAKNRLKDFLLNILIKTTGKKVSARLIFFIFRIKVDFSRLGYQVAQCNRCGFFFRNPTYLEKSLPIVYNSNNYFKFLSGQYSKKRLNLYKYLIKRIDFVRRTADFSRKRFLDIGCGYGLFLNHIKTLGWDCYGIDFASDCIEIGKQRFGLTNIVVGNLNDDTFKENFFDAVSLISVAAHLDHPITMFKKIHKVLRPGGILLIWTVNADSLMHKQLLGQWRGFAMNHLVFFNSSSLVTALKKSGFSSIDIGYDVRLFNSLKSKQEIPKVHSEYFEKLMRQKNLGDMILAAAYNG